jgi:hypothetical protein
MGTNLPTTRLGRKQFPRFVVMPKMNFDYTSKSILVGYFGGPKDGENESIQVGLLREGMGIISRHVNGNESEYELRKDVNVWKLVFKKCATPK